MHEPLTVALADGYPLVSHGLRRMLSPYRFRVRVVELATDSSAAQPVDLVLYDPVGPGRGAERVQALVRHPSVKYLVLYTWTPEAPVVAEGLEAGAVWMLSKALGAAALVEALEKIHAGERPAVRSSAGLIEGADPAAANVADVGHLTGREVDVLTLIARGLTNTEIAAELYLTPNSVKSYIRNAYRKIGVARRSQAVAWGITHRLGEDIKP